MTNEELCVLIKQGDSGYLPQLWEQVRAFIAKSAASYYALFERKNGVEVEDLIQSGYFAVLDAVKYYEPEKGFKFLTFLTKTLKNSFRDTMGIKTQKRDMLNFSSSLNAPVGEEGEAQLLDLIGDLTPGSGDVEAHVVESVYHEELRRALDNALSILSEEKRSLIEMHYYFNLSFDRLAEGRSVSRSAIYAKVYDALGRVYNSSHRPILETFLNHDNNPYSGSSYSAWKNQQTSVTERLATKTISRRKCSNGSDGNIEQPG